MSRASSQLKLYRNFDLRQRDTLPILSNSVVLSDSNVKQASFPEARRYAQSDIIDP